MHRIIITDYVDTITLLPDLKIEITPKEIGKQAEMASGRAVKDVVGYKDRLKIPVGYLPLEDVRKLQQMIRRNAGYLTISICNVAGDRTEKYVVEEPTYTTFSYDENGVAVWRGVIINATTAEVVT